MPQLRVASLWRLHLGLTCLGIMIAVPLLSGGDKPGQETRQQIAQSTHLHSTQTVHSVAAVIADRAEKLREEDAFLAEKNLGTGSESPARAAAGTAGRAETADGTDDVAARVVLTSAVDDSAPSESGPNLGGGSEPPGEATAEQSSSPAAAQPPPAQATSGPFSKLTLLPQWLRRLPETLTRKPESVSDPPATTQPPAKSTTILQAPSAAEAAPLPPATAKPKPKAKPQKVVAQKVDDSWREPETLIAGLKDLAGSPAASWATAVLQQLAALRPAVAAGADEAKAILDRLDTLGRQTVPLSAGLSDRALVRRWREMGYALNRRVVIWRQVARLEKTEASDFVSRALDPRRLADCLAEAEAATNDSPQGKGWQGFLLFDDLRQHCVQQSPPDQAASREAAAQTLARMTQIPLTPEQQRFMSSPPLAALRLELWHWAARPVGVAELLADLERYEWTRLPSDAERLAIDCQDLSVSSSAVRRQLAALVDAHYRNANVRFSIGPEFLNDLIPEQKLQYSPVNGTVVGRPVQGDSLAETRVAVRMLPDPHRARLAMEVTGEIASLTSTDAGMATIHNESEASYKAIKPMEIDMQALRLWPVEIEVQNETRVNGMETSVNNVPLIGWIARSVARSQVDKNMGAATEEMKQKIVAQATDRINDEVSKRFGDAVERLNQRVFDPLNSLALDPQLVEAKTTQTRLTMRLRVGGEDQLGSHTPRPPSLSDSLASVQIHESVLNNGIGRLHFDGQTFTLGELSRHVAASLNCPAPWPISPENEDVRITFAKQNAVVVRCQDGQLVLSLGIARLCKGTRYRWNNFEVRASYQPVVHGRSAQLVRNNVIQLSGKRSVASQMILRGVFAHALSRNTPWELVPQRIINEPKLQDTAITQFVIDDGWIGLSLGPKQTTTAHRTRFGTR